MKSFSPGLSDSIASVITNPAQCPHCDSSSQIVGGLCVGCLLQSGLDSDDECAPETLVSALAEITLPDKNWRLGNYEILEEIGRGGMGVIYRARQRHSRRIVAVKRVLGYHADSRETLARFRREAQAAASLDHPNILPIYEVSESEDGLPFFSMKFAPGGSLQEVGPALRNDPRQCVAFVAKIARAVQYAHGKGILHRDLKPGNILLDAHGEPLVSDFGLAKWLDTTSDLTRTLTIFGTPGYIAPEQASGSAAQLKPTADVYSLGAILFDLLAGRPPFLGAHALSVIRQAAESPAPKLRTLSKIADRDLETICAHCLERDPAARYHSAHDLAEDLERWLEGRPIIARPVSAPHRLWRLAKRNPLLTAAAIICLIAGSVAVSRQLSSWQLTETVTEQIAAQHSIEVAPFLDLDSGQIDREIGSALASEFRQSLTQIGPARVHLRPQPGTGDERTMFSSMANSTAARAVLLGTRRLWNGKVRISVRMLKAGSGETFIHRLLVVDDDPRLPKEIAKTLAKEAYARLNSNDLAEHSLDGDDPGIKNKDSRELITSGRELATRPVEIEFERAVACFRKAISLEPRSSIAHSCLSMALTMQVAYGSKRQFLILGEQEAREALALNDGNGEAHRMLAAALHFQGKFSEALEEIQQAFECTGTNSRGASLAAHTYSVLGRPDKALTWFSIAKLGEPHPAEHDAAIGDCWSDLGEDNRAEAAYRRYWNLRPQHSDGWVGICRLLLLQGKFSEAQALTSKHAEEYREFGYTQKMAAQVEFFARNFVKAKGLYAELASKDPNGGGEFYGAVSYQSALGYLEMAAGDKATGRAILLAAREKENEKVATSPSHPEILYRLAAIEASLGNTDSAISHLRASTEAGWIGYRSLALDPRFDSLRENPLYLEILQNVFTHVASLPRATVDR